ncbi:MAG: hypothetical protein ACRC51_08880 [Cetobacterium sp.]
MVKISPKEVISLCQNCKRFYREGTTLFILKDSITYKIYNVTEESFFNLQRKIYEINLKTK